MLYEAYEAKMKRVAEVLDRIRKYRVLIIICLTLILLAIGAFLFVKGMLLSDAIAPNQPIVYGDAVEFRGKALFGRTASQYKAAGDGEWSEGFPVLPGEYVVRAVSNRSFGFKQYGAEQTVTVLKRALTVTVANTAVYGEAPEPSCEGMISGDRVDSLSVKYADPYATSTEAVIEALTVLNESGTDVTVGYDISFKDATVTFEKRPITIKTDSAEKVYDGLPLTAEGATVSGGSIAYADSFTYSSYPSLTDAVEGGIENIPSGLRIVNNIGTDVTHMYSVTVDAGRLTVLKREITVASCSDEKVYDGEPFDSLTADITSGDLADGQSIKYSFVNGAVTNAGSFENLVNAVITDGSGKDVSRNYGINKECGTLNITPRPVTVTGSDRTWIFDGLVHSASTLSPRFTVSNRLDDGGLLNGHTVECKTYATIHTVGEAENTPTEIKIKNASGADVTANYEVITVSGTLTVIKRAITVTVHDAAFVYNGNERRYPDSDSSGKYYSLALGEQAKLPEGMATDTALVESDAPLGVDETKAISITCNYMGSLTRVGKTEITAYAHVTQGADVTNCYDITVISGTLTVVPRKITLTPERVSGVYNGKTVAVNELQTNAEYADTVPQDEMNMRIIPIVWISAEGTVVGEYKSHIQRWQIKTASGEDISDCFEVTNAEGVYEIQPRAIKIILNSGEWVYDGTAHRLAGDSAYTVVSLISSDPSALCNGHTLELATEGEITDVGTEAHILKGVPIILDSDGNDVTKNYSIDHENGTLTVLPRPLAIEIASADKVYDGKELTKDGFDILSGSVADGQTLTVGISGSRITVGATENVGTVTVTAGDRDVTHNYDITVTNGTLTVTPRPLHITTGSAEKVYDGTALTDDRFEIISGTVADGQKLTVTVTGSVLNAESLPNTATATVEDGAEDVTSNYDITFRNGTLTITHRPITIKTASGSKVFDGAPLTADHYEVISGSVADGQSLNVTVIGSLIKVGTSINDAIITVKSGEDDVTANYDITEEFGTLTVTKRPVKVVIEAVGFTYDGITRNALEVCTLTALEEDGYYGLVDGHALNGCIVFTSDRITTYQTVRYAGEYTVDIERAGVYETTYGVVQTDNYELEIVSCSLTVLPRAITVTAASGKFEYDGNTHYASELEPNYYATLNADPSADGVGEGDLFTVTVGGSILLPGTAPSTVEGVSIVEDATGKDVTFCYAVTVREGELTMLPSKINVVSGSAEKVYDGTPLVHHSFDLHGVLYPGDRIIAEYTGSQTEIGESENYFTYRVLNAEGEDVTDTYSAFKGHGKLRVVEKPPTGDLGGDISNAKPDEGADKTVFTYVATSDGRIYFRSGHFGNYDHVYGWLTAPSGEDSYTYTILSEALMTNRPRETVTVKPIGSMLYFSTYYADKSTVGEGRTDSEYSVSYYQYDYLRESGLPVYSASLKEYERACREFAYTNYTDLPEETRAAMQEVIVDAVNAEGVDIFSMSRKKLVEWVCNYIKGAAEYDLQFPDFPEGVDKAIYFLTVAKRGVCRHYATSAVVMYRTLGIPARYVTGYASTAVAGETVEVTGMEAHAWVEVYIDGVGWIAVDPTGGSGGEGEGGGEGGEGPTQPTEKKTVVLAPYAIKKVYTGKPITCGNDQFWVKSGSEHLPAGYRIEVIIEGSQTSVGKGKSIIKYVNIYDADGNDITSEYDVRGEEGVIEVMPIKIVVHTASASKDYDGRKLSAEECTVAMGKLLDGHTLKAEGYTYIVNIGSVSNSVESIEIYDKDGNRVTDCYDIQVVEGTLTVSGG